MNDHTFVYRRALTSATTGAARLALVILSMEADSRGVVILPGEELAARMAVDIRIARMAIKTLGQSGDLVWRRGGGRGRPSVYGILSGLTADEAAELVDYVLNGDHRSVIEDRNSDHRSVIEDDNGDQGSPFQGGNSDLRSVNQGLNGDLRSVNQHPHESTLHDHDHDHEGLQFSAPAGPGSAGAPAEPDKVIKDPNQFAPACLLYKEITGYRPNRTQAQWIAQGYTYRPAGRPAVSRPPITDLGLWRQALEQWRATYANSLNLAGMLDWYHEPARMAPPADRSPHGTHRRTTAGPGRPAAGPGPADLARRMAELESAADVPSTDTRAAAY